jgi:hypothetical protein
MSATSAERREVLSLDSPAASDPFNAMAGMV